MFKYLVRVEYIFEKEKAKVLIEKMIETQEPVNSSTPINIAGIMYNAGLFEKSYEVGNYHVNLNRVAQPTSTEAFKYLLRRYFNQVNKKLCFFLHPLSHT